MLLSGITVRQLVPSRMRPVGSSCVWHGYCYVAPLLVGLLAAVAGVDCPPHCSLDRQLVRRFGFGVDSAAAGVDCPVQEVDGFFKPALVALPMGWTWSVFLAQHVHERIVSKVISKSEHVDTILINDKNPHPCIEPWWKSVLCLH